MPSSPHHRWQAPAQGLLTGTRWPGHLARDRALDPYLIWADSTGFLGFGGWDDRETQLAEQRLPLLLEFDAVGRSPADTPELALLRIPAMYLEDATPSAPLNYRHATGLVQATEVEKLLCCPHLSRFQLGAPRLPGVGEAPPAFEKPISDSRRTVLGFIDHGCAFAHPQLAGSDGRTRLHALWDQGRPAGAVPPPPAGAPGWWSRDPALGYGMELRREALVWAAAHTGRDDDPAKAGLAPYDVLDYVPQRLAWGQPATRRHGTGQLTPPLGAMASGTHGTATMDLAMGLQPPLRQRLRCSDTADQALRDSDTADDWAAVFVQLPGSTVMDTTGGSLAFHVVDGLHYIVDRARRIPPKGQESPGDRLEYLYNPIVVTLGYGALAGAHDGRSIAEQAIDDLVSSMVGNLWVVVAAGNAHRRQGHASLRLRPGQPGQLTWSVPPDNPLESYLEVWLPTHDDRGRPVPGVAERMRVEIHPPGVEPIQLTQGEWLTLQDEREADPARGCVAGAVFACRVAQTELESTMVLLACAPTRRALPGEGPARALGRAGDWTISLTWQPLQDAQPGPVIELHAWAERSDLVFGHGRGLQSRVMSDAPHPLPTEAMPAARHAAAGPHEADDRLYAAFGPSRSLGSLAGGAAARERFAMPAAYGPQGAVVTVGAYRLSDGEMSADSSSGPDRQCAARDVVEALRGVAAGRNDARLQPDADAPGDRSPAVRGLPVAGTRAGGVDRLSATSAAAPTVARAIANANTTVQPGTRGEWADRERALLAAELPAADRPAASPGLGRAHPARGTPQPTLDDRFRRGRWRAR